MSRVYVGNLPFDATEVELREVFSRMGFVRKIWIAKRPPGFAFIHYQRPLDALDAVEFLDGTKICGLKARVELCEDMEQIKKTTGRRRESTSSNSDEDRRPRKKSTKKPQRGRKRASFKSPF
ncbi:unnamed protein product [Caenorhabditis auriculariae]|uniref:RRM domain-containing protein n=1 Tax=Caenorhabditis auriculariae TaxID=2777116 RepID=A0A8S1HDG9_9PELO|nr:unnamed protein product [Caenorhabditis auriculariae]